MDDQLDNDLKNRIREVFENFGDTSADDGWLELRKKFPEEARNRRAFAWIWWGAAAAVFFLFFGIGFWIYDAKVQPQKFTHNKLKNTKPQNTNNTKEHLRSVNKTTAVNENNLTKINSRVRSLNPVNESKLKLNRKAGNSKPSNENNLAESKRKAENSKPANENNLAKSNNRTGDLNSIKSLLKYKKYREPGIISQTLKNDTLAPKADLAQATDSNKANNNLQSQQLNAVVKPNNEPPNSVIVIPKPPAKSINSMFAEDKKIEAKKSLEKSDKRVRFGLYAATYFNYAKGSNNQINVGAGFTSDIKLSNNLKLVTGITIAQNSLNYTGGNSVIIAQTQSNSFPSTTSSVSPSNYGVSSVATLKNHTASLVGLDVPLNLKYEFNPQKSDAYFSAGLSSGTFINETYKSQYSSQTYYSSSVQQTQGETTSKSFNSFYFAKMLNVAMGVGFPFGKNRLILEPFLKYPIGGLGSQNIHFGAGGINLKFNFQSPKK